VSGPGIGPIGTAAAVRPERDRLREAAQQFEGVFIAQLFQAMRATVPADQADPGQEMFTAMMDDTVANMAATKSVRGMGESLYRQMAARLEPGSNAAPNGVSDGHGSR
jgi:Rod binding domain-containing protein